MRLILDTHILLWAVADSEQLPERARDLLLDPDHDFVVSIASLWEIAIKYQLRRGAQGDMPINAEQAAQLTEEAGFGLLPVLLPHVLAVEHLPRQSHADPFDRLLIAQARSEPMRLLTHDRKLESYGESVLLV